ncbi:phage terminase small subunit [Enterococcus sp. SMC-9]|uniref:phage terminase small subunit n=1 Tax=Enterococcus sp. SMC-9 TaxID=2862343 RepID=UPI001E2BF31D|nr:phage terminase small subunit [Enterococcus sp. SMC-9]MCD1023483.1 small subunit of terminase [Enterococcus sp. SMC-9]
MARQRNPRRDQALKIFIERNGEVSNRELASFLDVPEKTISAWKFKDKWKDKLNGVLQSNERSTPKNKGSTSNKSGAPLGNQNAVGNKGNAKASAPAGNKNAVTTGEHESIFLETMSDDEKDLYSTMSEDPFFVMTEEVRLLKIRQLRMMKRIQKAEAGLNESELEYLQELRGRTAIMESTKQKGNTELVLTEVKERKTRKIDDVLRIEDALTRVSGQLQKAIKQLEEIALNKRRLVLIEAQTDHTKAQTTKALINKDGDENDGGTVINIIDDITAQGQEGEENG